MLDGLRPEDWDAVQPFVEALEHGMVNRVVPPAELATHPFGTRAPAAMGSRQGPPLFSPFRTKAASLSTLSARKAAAFRQPGPPDCGGRASSFSLIRHQKRPIALPLLFTGNDSPGM